MQVSTSAYGLAWTREDKEVYLLTQYMLPSQYTSNSEYSTISSISNGYKTYIEYGITPEWTVILDFEKTDVHDIIDVETEYPTHASYTHYGPYQKYNGSLMLSRQISRDQYRALSGQIAYKSGEYIYAHKGKYYPEYEEISLGISQGVSRPIYGLTNGYVEYRYTPSLYHKVMVYSPESEIKLGLNTNGNINIEIGLSHKMNKVYIKNSPHQVSEEDFPCRLKYLERDVNSLLRFKEHKDVLTTHCKLSYQFNKKHGIELGIFRSSNSASERDTIYSIGYILRW